MAEFVEVALGILRVHGRLTRVIEAGLRRDSARLTAEQALVIWHIGEKVSRPKDLVARGEYMGTNVSYTLTKLENAGLLARATDKSDRRETVLRLTTAGEKIHAAIGELFRQHGSDLKLLAQMDDAKTQRTMASLRELELFWNERLLYWMG